MVQTPPYQPVSTTLGSKSVSDIALSVIAYLQNPKTKDRIFDYDFGAYSQRQAVATGQSATRITRETIQRAQKLKADFHRSLAMTEDDAIDFAFAWFSQQEKDAPWHIVPNLTDFVQADPTVIGSHYDDLCEIWYHFYDERPDGIGGTQINKVLHQVLPDNVVIYDTVLSDLYLGKRLGREVKKARKLQDTTNRWNNDDGFGWEPLRRDMALLTANDESNIRHGITVLPCQNPHVLGGLPANVWAAQNLSLVRLIDMVAWQ